MNEKKSRVYYLLFPYNEEMSIAALVHGMLCKLRHQLA